MSKDSVVFLGPALADAGTFRRCGGERDSLVLGLTLYGARCEHVERCRGPCCRLDEPVPLRGLNDDAIMNHTTTPFNHDPVWAISSIKTS